MRKASGNAKPAPASGSCYSLPLEPSSPIVVSHPIWAGTCLSKLQGKCLQWCEDPYTHIRGTDYVSPTINRVSRCLGGRSCHSIAYIDERVVCTSLPFPSRLCFCCSMYTPKYCPAPEEHPMKDVSTPCIQQSHSPQLPKFQRPMSNQAFLRHGDLSSNHNIFQYLNIKMQR